MSNYNDVFQNLHIIKHDLEKYLKENYDKNLPNQHANKKNNKLNKSYIRQNMHTMNLSNDDNSNPDNNKSDTNSLSVDKSFNINNEFKHLIIERPITALKNNHEKPKTPMIHPDKKNMNWSFRNSPLHAKNPFLLTISNGEDIRKWKPIRKKTDKDSNINSQKHLKKEELLSNTTKLLTIDLDTRIMEKNKELELKRKENVLPNFNKPKNTPIKRRNGNKLVLFRADIIPMKPIEALIKPKIRYESANVAKRKRFYDSSDNTSTNESRMKEKSTIQLSNNSLVDLHSPSKKDNQHFINIVASNNEKNTNKDQEITNHNHNLNGKQINRNTTPSPSFRINKNQYQNEPKYRNQQRNATPKKNNSFRAITPQLIPIDLNNSTIEHEKFIYDDKNMKKFHDARYQFQSRGESNTSHLIKISVLNNQHDFKRTPELNNESLSDSRKMLKPYKKKEEQINLKSDDTYKKKGQITHNDSKGKLSFDELMKTLSLRSEIDECTKLIKATKARNFKRVGWVDDPGDKINKEHVKQVYKALNVYHRDHIFQ